MNPVKLLLLNMNFIGDTLFTTPAIAALRAHYPDAFIVNVVHPRCTELFKANPHVDVTLARPVKGYLWNRSFIMQLRQWHFDASVLFSRSSSGLALVGRLAAPRVVGLDNSRIARLLTDKVPELMDQHMAANCLGLACALGAKRPDNPKMEFWLSQEDQQEAVKLLSEAGIHPDEPLIGMVAGASTEVKRWPVDRFAKVAQEIHHRYGIRSLILGGPGDLSMADAIASEVSPKPIILAGKTSLNLSGALIARCSVMISGDTGPLHMSSAVGTPVVGIFGPTDPVRTGIYGGPGIVLRGNADNRIPGVEEVEVKAVINAVDTLLKNNLESNTHY